MVSLSPIHWLIVIVVLVLLFGAKRLPDASRSVGRSLRIFKSEMKHMAGDGEKAPGANVAIIPSPAAAPAPQQLPPAPVPASAPNTPRRTSKLSAPNRQLRSDLRVPLRWLKVQRCH